MNAANILISLIHLSVILLNVKAEQWEFCADAVLFQPYQEQQRNYSNNFESKTSLKVVKADILETENTGLTNSIPVESIDWARARSFMLRRQKGERLSVDEQVYLERAIAIRKASGAGNAVRNQRKPPAQLRALCDLAANDRYEKEDGGLYGKGQNTPPEVHRRASEAQLLKIRPLNTEGEPDADGIIAFIAISMSNATQEFSRFKQIADDSPLKSGKVVIVDCAQGGQAMAEWAPMDAAPWKEAMRRLNKAKVSPIQVQTAWIKLANKGPTGTFQEHVGKLELDTLVVLSQARRHFPNLRIVYLGSRIYGGYATSNLNPEPYAYESAFAARRLILRQISLDPEFSTEKIPLLLWGPYLWANGTEGRKLDSLTWERSDLGPDGVHPSNSGRQKVADQLMHFFTNNALAKPWFTGHN